MTAYTKLTNFTVKDSLSSGDPDKVILGEEIDDEYDAIALAVNSKLNALQADVAAVLSPQTSLEATGSAVPSTFVPDAYSILRYGAVGDDSTNDAPAALVAMGLGSNYTLINPGLTYKFVPSSTSPYTFGNDGTINVYAGVLFTGSDKTVVGSGAEIHITSRSAPASSDLQFCYATAKNLTLGTQKHLTFSGVTVDVENNSDVANSNHRFGYFTGVDGLRFLNTRGYSSGTRRGNFANIQNSRNVQIHGHFSYKQTQICNFRYTQNVCITGLVAYDFSEGLDFDGTQDRSVVSGACFESTNRVNQMIDINGQVDGVFAGMTAYTLGQIANISHKATTPDNFADYVAGAAVVAKTPSQRIFLGGVSGRAIGSSTSPSISISNDWSDGGHAGYDPTHDVVLHGIQLEDTSYWMIWECDRLSIRDCYLGSVITAASNYAVDTRSLVGTSDQFAWSTLTGVIDGLTINGAERGGLRVQNAKWMNIRNVSVHNINTLGGSDFAIQLNGLHQRGAQITIDGLNITSGNVNINGTTSSIAAWAGTTAYSRGQVVSNGGRYYRATSVSGTSAGAGGPTGITSGITDGTVTWEYLSEPFSIQWGPNNRLAAGCAIQFTGDAHKYTHGRVASSSLGDLAATGTVTRELFVATRKCYVCLAKGVVAANVAVDATNLRNFSVKSLTNLGATTTTISSMSTAAGLTAHVPFDLGFAASEAGAFLEPGDVIYVEITSASAGAALTGLRIQVEVLDC